MREVHGQELRSRGMLKRGLREGRGLSRRNKVLCSLITLVELVHSLAVHDDGLKSYASNVEVGGGVWEVVRWKGERDEEVKAMMIKQEEQKMQRCPPDLHMQQKAVQHKDER